MLERALMSSHEWQRALLSRNEASRGVFCIVRGARGIDLREVCARPRHQRTHELTQRRTERSELVLHARWNFGIHGSSDHSVALQATQCHGQHPLTDPLHSASQLAEAQRSRVAEHVHHIHGPLVAYPSEDLTRVTVR